MKQQLLRYAILLIGSVLAGVIPAAGPRGEVMELKVVKVSSAPALDGKLDDRIWLEAALYGSKSSGFVNAPGTGLIEFQPMMLAAYDQDCLYLAVRCYVPDTDKLTAKGKPGEFDWGDDLIQVFFEPKLDGWYVHYGINCKGVTTLETIKAAASSSKTYWVLETAVPWKVLQVTPKEGMAMGFNMAGCQAAGGEGWITLAPTYGGFHNTSRFGYLVLGSALPANKMPTRIEEDDF